MMMQLQCLNRTLETQAFCTYPRENSLLIHTGPGINSWASTTVTFEPPSLPCMSSTETSIGSTQDLHASLVHTSSSSSHPEDVRSRIISVSFEHLPVEIVGLIAFHAEPCDLSALCRVNRYCSAVCSAVLYGDHIIINDSQSLSLLHNTLLRLRPDLALVVRGITIHAGVGGAGWWLSGPAG